MTVIQSTSTDRYSRLGARYSLIARDRAYYIIIGLFVLVTGVTATVLGRSYLLSTVLDYVRSWTLLATAALLISLSPRFVVRAWRERPEHPGMLALEVLRDALRPHVVAGLVLYLALAVFMGAFTTLKTMLPCLNAFWADPWLAQIDRALHFGQQPWRLLHPLLGHRPVTRFIELVYGPVWMLCVVLVPLFFCVTRRAPEHRRRFLIAYLLTWIVNGIVLAGLFMSGGPAFYGKLVHDDAPFGDLVRYLDMDVDVTLSAAWAQHELWRLQEAAASGLGAGISAFPSLHVSMILLCCLGMWRIDRRAAWLLIAVAAVILVGAVHLGWHYAVDDYVVTALMATLWWVSGRLAATPFFAAPPRA